MPQPMLTPKQRLNLTANIKGHGLNEALFQIDITSEHVWLTHHESKYYFLFSVYPPHPVSIANLISEKLLDFHIKYTPVKLNPHLSADDFSRFGAESWEKAVSLHLNKWLFWLKEHYGPFEETFTQKHIEEKKSSQSMNSEDFIKKQAQEAVEMAFRYSIHHKTDKVSDVIIEKAQRLHRIADRVSYFDEAIRLVNDKIAEHRSTCSQGAGCHTEKKHEQVIFYLQQELEKLPNSASSSNAHLLSPMPTPNNEIEKIFISHSSKDVAIVEEVIDLLEVAGVEPSQIFCSSFEGYSIEPGQDFLQRIKDELNSNVLVLFIITANFYASPVSLCEMGAAWVRTSKHIPIIVPPLSYEDIKGVIPSTHALKINDPLRWNTLKEQLERWLSIQNTAPASVWERKRNKAIQAINQKIVAATSVTPAKKQDPLGNVDLKEVFRGIE